MLRTSPPVAKHGRGAEHGVAPPPAPLPAMGTALCANSIPAIGGGARCAGSEAWDELKINDFILMLYKNYIFSCFLFE